MFRWQAGEATIGGDDHARVMAVVNVTPDSFSGEGRPVSAEQAIALGQRLAAEGAHLLDIGGESSRPGAEPVALGEELRRVVPVIEGLAATVRVPISIDTMKPEVARQALRAGATIVNDITALADPDMARLVADTGAGVVLMHMAGTPQTMQDNPHYDNVVTEVRDYLARRAKWAESAGIAREKIALDPGIGFGKTNAHSLDLLRNLGRFATLDYALLVGISRKGLLGKLTGRPVHERTLSTVVASLAAVAQGAQIVRVHDVGPMVEALKVWEALRNAQGREPS